MGVIRGIFQSIYDLLVEDGSIALGTLGALLLAGLWVRIAGVGSEAADLGGPVLFILLMALLLTNLYRTGRDARRKSAGR